jgi:hypothetical protein
MVECLETGKTALCPVTWNNVNCLVRLIPYTVGQPRVLNPSDHPVDHIISDKYAVEGTHSWAGGQ